MIARRQSTVSAPNAISLSVAALLLIAVTAVLTGPASRQVIAQDAQNARSDQAQQATAGYENWLREYIQLTEGMTGVLKLIRDEASARQIADPLRELSAKWFAHSLDAAHVASKTDPADQALGQKYGPRIGETMQAMRAQLQRINELGGPAAQLVRQAMAQGKQEAEAMVREKRAQDAQADAPADAPAEAEADADTDADTNAKLPADASADALVQAMIRQIDGISEQLATVEDEASLRAVAPELARFVTDLQTLSNRFGAAPAAEQAQAGQKHGQALTEAQGRFQEQINRIAANPQLQQVLQRAMAGQAEPVEQAEPAASEVDLKSPLPRVPQDADASEIAQGMIDHIERTTKLLKTAQDQGSLEAVVPQVAATIQGLNELTARFKAAPAAEQAKAGAALGQTIKAAQAEFQAEMDRIGADPDLKATFNQAMAKAKQKAAAAVGEGASVATKSDPFLGPWLSTHFNPLIKTMTFGTMTFFPGGVVYDGLAPGWYDLQYRRDQMPQDGEKLGSFTREGQKITVQWEDGKTEHAELKQFDYGPVVRFEERYSFKSYFKGIPIPADTRWDNTFSNISGIPATTMGGPTGSFGKSITFTPDGQYSFEGMASMAADQDLDAVQDSGVAARGQLAKGRYEFQGLTVRLTIPDGQSKIVPCFMIDWDEEKPGPSLIYLDGFGMFLD